MASPGSPGPAPRLRRVLTLWDLVLYGIILIQPTAPMPLFGIVMVKAQGHVATTLLIGMFAMMLTAMSYGRMARAYPSAGSAYTFVGRELNPHLGFLTGWSMAMDYVLNPLICVIWCSKAVMKMAGIDPTARLPYVLLAIFFALMFTMLNLRGIKATARTNAVLAAGMGAVVLAFFIAAVRYVVGGQGFGGLFSLQPFYDPARFRYDLIFQGTSIAVLTYIGFDGISTLSEEVENPKKNILYATVLVCLITGVLGGAEVYLAQRVWPTPQFADPDTGFVDAAARAASSFGTVASVVMLQVITVTLLIANIGSGSGAQLGAARLLYGMGRDNVIPRRFFGRLEPRRNTPRNNVLLVGAIALAGALLMTYQLGAELLNFGAFIAFMGVNLSSLTHYFVRGERSFKNAIVQLIPPAVGFLVCFYIWLNLSTPARIGGGLWLASGVLYTALKTGFFRKQLVMPELPAEE